MAFGDFCFDPTGNLLNVLKSDTFAYYITCSGTSPFASLESSLNSYVATLGTLISSLYSSGDISATCLNSLTNIQVQMTNNVNSLANLVFGCQFVNNLYNTVVLQGLCTYTFSGLYNLWVLQFIIAIALFFIISFAKVVYHSYVHAEDGSIITAVVFKRMKAERMKDVGINEVGGHDVEASRRPEGEGAFAKSEIELSTSALADETKSPLATSSFP